MCSIYNIITSHLYFDSQVYLRPRRRTFNSVAYFSNNCLVRLAHGSPVVFYKNTMAPMNRLPAELIDRLCDCLSNDSDLLKNLRLLSRRFSRKARNIFHTLVLYQQPDKWQNIQQIATTEALAKCVHTIKLLRENCLPRYKPFECWKRETENFRQMLCDIQAIKLLAVLLHQLPMVEQGVRRA